MREQIGRRFSVLIGCWHDRLVGPHTLPMDQVAFANDQQTEPEPGIMADTHPTVEP